jgi:putative transposase
LTTKIHASVDAQGRPVHLHLTPGQSGDAPEAASLLEDHSAEHVLADAAYDSDALREQIRKSGGKACIKPNRSRKVKKRYAKRRYRNRNIIERFFGRIKHYRRVATRYDKKPENYLGFVWLAAVLTTIP